jgi:hypothetical protein
MRIPIQNTQVATWGKGSKDEMIKAEASIEIHPSAE